MILDKQLSTSIRAQLLLSFKMLYITLKLLYKLSEHEVALVCALYDAANLVLRVVEEHVLDELLLFGCLTPQYCIETFPLEHPL